jgi:hypothetical protein
MKPPVFVFQSVSNHGTSNPIVARLALQSFEMMKWVDLTEKEREAANKQLFDLHGRLLRCFECVRTLRQRESETLEKTRQIAANQNRTIPFVIGLQDEVETFLTSAKQFLRDLVGPFNTIYRANLKNDAAVFWDKAGGASAAEKWATAHFGTDNSLALLLREDAFWIGELIKRRNAREHPGDLSGTLVIENYRFVGPAVSAPSWRRDTKLGDGERSPVLPDLERHLIALLEFGEELIAQAVKLRPAHNHLEVYEIPEDKRDQKNPARFRVSLDAILLKSLAEADATSNS